MSKSKSKDRYQDVPTLFRVEAYTNELRYHPDWDDMQEDEEFRSSSSHVGSSSSHVESKRANDVPTCELIYQWVEVYPVKRVNYYFRYSYIDKSAKIPQVVKHHIPGGNTFASIAINRKNAVENAIASGAQPSRIEAMIKAWKKHTKTSGGK